MNRPLSTSFADGIKPLIQATVPFDNAAEAHRILAAREMSARCVQVP